MRPLGWPFAVMLVPLFPAAVVASWWLVGDQTNDEARELAAQGVKLDYSMEPITLGAAGDRVLGIAGCAAVVALVAILVAGSATRRMHRAWWGVAASVVLLGGYLGLVERTFTAGGIGANIGAGLVFLSVLPCTATFLVPAVSSTVMLVRERRRARAERWPVVAS
ncbi:hypothetical protein FHR83_008991 [Actinoplanes campanulatus]|uniref:Uncharacterized protein n=1 Tax=Actinoplanes campanulatus TaxID=113559 RepID=A0A7W5ARX2_9ACTN|nr:hypothetical protein [Actinoplanes campanulatus]MBB3101263.1 hypothetical protein [Actinoplanes campanulatus]GGN50851.1 hypothetical protein GCM10010109_90460 [Actinoplanes campanulatus]GID42147.1 hypothetical protein Aca09nite_86530 [Actinoplanes campanulatus]